MKYAIFDLDGTLLDFEGISGQALAEVVSRFNKTFTREMHACILGTPHSSWSRRLIQEYELEKLISPDELVHAYHQAVTALFPTMKLMPGAETLLRELKARRVPIAIATSSASHTVPLKTVHHPVFTECVDIVVTGDDPLVLRGKPDPDIFLLAAKRLGCESSDQCVVFEDAPAGVQGGIRAGMHVVAVPDFRFLSKKVFDDHSDTFEHKSVTVLDSLEKFNCDSCFIV